MESILPYVTSIGRTQTQFQLEKLFTIIEKKGYPFRNISLVHQSTAPNQLQPSPLVCLWDKMQYPVLLFYPNQINFFMMELGFWK